MRTEKELLQEFSQLRVSTAGKQRAPHKPLLVLLVLGLWYARGQEHFTYDDIAQPLERLLREFLPAKVRNPNPAMPFFHLRRDGVWKLVDPKNPNALAALKEPSIALFRRDAVFGTFTDDVWTHLRTSPSFFGNVVAAVVQSQFPPTLYADVLEAVGLEIGSLAASPSAPVWDLRLQKRRDPEFKLKVLDSYSWRCAVCGFEARLRGRHVGVEAAHVQWHSHDGPDVIPNGVALCALHHHLFDRGVFTITHSRRVRVCQDAEGSATYVHMMSDFDDKEVKQPRRSVEYIAEEYLDWHVAEVFQG